MDPLDAFYHVIHDYPGGAEALAPRMGYTSAVLRNKADPRKDSNKPLLDDADKITALTGDARVIRALAHKHGFLLVKAPDNQCGVSDMSVLEQVVAFMVASGAYGQEIHKALADGSVSQEEVKRIMDAGQDVMTSIAETTQRLRGMAE